MKASDLILKCFEKQGVSDIYGVPGEENADVMISLLDSPIQFTTCRHEQTAGFIAAMQGYLTGTPGVCLSTLGPGAANLVTAIGQANMDHYPLVALIGQASTQRLHKVSHQNMDSVEMYEQHTKWSVTIRDADAIPEIIAKAFKIATQGRPGAVVVELPEDIAQMTSEAQILPKMHTTYYNGASRTEIHQVLNAIANSQQPILLAGDGAVRQRIDEPLQTFLHKTQIYSATTFMGKGAISDDYECSLHCVGMGMKDIALEAFNQADLVICVGYDMVEWPPIKWNPDMDKTIIHIASKPAEVDKAYLPAYELIGNLNTIMNQLNRYLTSDHCHPKECFASIKQKEEHDLSLYEHHDSYPLKPAKVLHDIRKTLQSDDMLICDVGAHKMWVARHYRAYQSKTCFISNGFCAMGGSMPGAIAAQKLFPKHNVVALCGDGGFAMSIQALFTAVHMQTPIVVIVWLDDQYGLIKWKQEMSFNQHSNIDLDNPQLEQMAQAIGCHTHTLQQKDDFQKHLEYFLTKKDRPSVLFVPIDYSENMKLFHHLEKIVQ